VTAAPGEGRARRTRISGARRGLCARLLVAVVLLSAGTWASAAEATDGAAGLVVGLSGRATLEVRPAAGGADKRGRRAEPSAPEGSGPRVLDLLDALTAGDVVGVAEGSTLWVLERPSTLWRLMGPARFTFGERGVSGPALEAARPSRFELEGLTELPADAVLAWHSQPAPPDRSAPAAAREPELSPSETAIRQPRPALAWTPGPVGERRSLGLWLLEAGGAIVPLERWDNLQTPSLTPWQALTPGTFVHWRVTPQDDGALAREPLSAWVYILTPAEAEAADAALAALGRARARWPEASDAIAVIRAWTEERHGLLEDALAGFARVAAERAEPSPRLDAHVRALRGRALTAPRSGRGAETAPGAPATAPR
jgi:hypothetical protein